MNTISMKTLTLVSAAMATAYSSGQNIADAYRTFVTADASYAASTRKCQDYPAAVGYPAFWFDAGKTDGWSVGAETKAISKIPSLPETGSSRYLTCDDSEIVRANYSGSNGIWDNATLYPPALKPSDGVLKGPYVDFGPIGSLQCLFFNKTQSDVNTLDGIGTVVGVYKSCDGGGYMLGGDDFSRLVEGKETTDAGRGTNIFNSVFHLGAPGVVQTGRFWSGLQVMAPETSRWSGSWEVVAVNPTSAGLTAHGVGVGDPNRAGQPYTSGGQAVAELLIYDKVLTSDELTQVVVYLKQKWLGESERGWNGNAHMSWLRVADSDAYMAAGKTISVSAGEGETLTIDRLTGGRGTVAPKIVKTGAGSLGLGDATAFGGEIQVQEGGIVLSRRSVPTTLPQGLRLDLDASAATLECDDNDRVSEWRNLATYDVKAVQGTAKYRPKLVANALGTGLNALDFGECEDGAFFSFSKACEYSTVIAVVDSRIYNGGNLTDNMYRPYSGEHQMNWAWTTVNRARLLYVGNVTVNEHVSLIPNDCGSVWVNGIKIDGSAEGVDAPSFNVVAYRTPVAAINYLGGRTQGRSGGMRIAEVLGWERALTEQEILDAQAYLARKWLGKTLPGYANDAGIADVGSVEMAAGTSIAVPAGSVARIAKLTASGTIVKKGSGTLLLRETVGTPGFVVEGGSVVGAAGPAVEQSKLAADPAMRLDASNASSLKLVEKGDVRYVWAWSDMSGKGGGVKQPSATSWDSQDMSRYPYVNSTDLCNGLPTVDFGETAYDYSTTAGRYLPLSRILTNIRSVYLVLGSQNGGGQPLGWVHDSVVIDYAGTSDSTRDFYRKANFNPTETPLYANASANVKNGELYVNGVAGDASTYIPNGGYQLVELHTTGGCMADALGVGFGNYLHGGCRIGEIVIYERELTEREKVATRNYLMSKWFGSTSPAPLPDEPDVIKPVISGLRPAAGETIVLADTYAIKNVTGEGTIEIASNAALDLTDISDFKGKLDVKGGVVRITGRPTAVEPKMLESDRVFHFDASEATSRTEGKEGDLTVVTSWRSKVNDVVAEAGKYLPYDPNETSTFAPILLKNELNGLDVIDMRWHGWGDKHRYYRFSKNSEFVGCEGVRSCFWVLGSQEGGGFFLGGGADSTQYSPLLRDNKGMAVGDKILSASASASAKSATWHVNFESVSPTATGVSGNYDLYAMNLASDSAEPLASVWGLAYDGRYMKNTNYRDFSGHQRLGEVIAYDRVLTAQEFEEVEAYLGWKWGFCQHHPTNCATVVIGSGSALVTTGNQYVEAIGGSGAVDGDISVGQFVCDGNGGLTISGTLTIGANPVFQVNPKDMKTTSRLVVAQATGYAGAENLVNARIVGVPGRYNAKARIKGGQLVLTRSRGFIVSIQ